MNSFNLAADLKLAYPLEKPATVGGSADPGRT